MKLGADKGSGKTETRPSRGNFNNGRFRKRETRGRMQREEAVARGRRLVRDACALAHMGCVPRIIIFITLADSPVGFQCL